MNKIELHIKWMAQYCGGTLDLAVLSDKDVNSLMPTLMTKLKEQSDAIGYDGFTGCPFSYPDMVWVMVYNGIVRPTVLEWIDETYPKAWYRPMYLPKDEQDKLIEIIKNKKEMLLEEVAVRLAELGTDSDTINDVVDRANTLIFANREI